MNEIKKGDISFWSPYNILYLSNYIPIMIMTMMIDDDDSDDDDDDVVRFVLDQRDWLDLHGVINMPPEQSMKN